MTPVRYRVGRKFGRTIYVQRGPEPSDKDTLVGILDTRGLALAAVEGLNAQALRDHEADQARRGTCEHCGRTGMVLDSRGRTPHHLAPLYRDVQRWDDERLPPGGPKLAVRCHWTGRVAVERRKRSAR